MLKFEISLKGVFLVAAVLVTLWALSQLWQIFILVTASFIFMAALLPYVEGLVRRGLPRVAAVLLVLLTVLVTVASLISIVVPAVIDEAKDVRDNLPQDAQQLEDFVAGFGVDTEDWDLKERAQEIDWGEFIDGRVAVEYGQRVFAVVFNTFTVIVLTAYLLADTNRLRAFVLRFVPPSRDHEVEHFIQALGRVVGGYVRGQLITSIIITLFTTTVLLIVQVPHPLAFGVLAGFADIIPLIGAFIAIIPAALAAFQESPTQALIVLGALLAYQQFEDRFLVPKVYGSTLNLPALVVLLVVLVGGELLGIVGILLSLPAAAAGRVVLDYYVPGRMFEGPKGDPLAPELPGDGPPPPRKGRRGRRSPRQAAPE
jgi:predicted PurR-regulated permease PerM